ncbi:hypothetical protein D3C85_1860600 [compost metagenome]
MRHGAATGFAHSSDHRLSRVATVLVSTQVVDHHCRTLGGQELCVRGAQATPGTGNDRDLSFQ